MIDVHCSSSIVSHAVPGHSRIACKRTSQIIYGNAPYIFRYACARPTLRLFPPECTHLRLRLRVLMPDVQCCLFGYVYQEDAKTHPTIRQREFSRDHYPNIAGRIKVLRRQYVRVVPYKIHPHCFGELEPLSVKVVAARRCNIHWVDRVVSISVEVVVPTHDATSRGWGGGRINNYNNN